MAVSVMTSKGQITIPKSVRDDLGLRPGSRISFHQNEEGAYELRRAQQPVSELVGSLRYLGPAKSIEEMDAGMAAGAAESMR